MREKPGFPALSPVSWEAWQNAGMRGWRRSADRTSLQMDSLLTGNFTGKTAISGNPRTNFAAGIGGAASIFRAFRVSYQGRHFGDQGIFWCNQGTKRTVRQPRPPHGSHPGFGRLSCYYHALSEAYQNKAWIVNAVPLLFRPTRRSRQMVDLISDITWNALWPHSSPLNSSPTTVFLFRRIEQ